MNKSKSLSLLIFSTDDIGCNIRLLSHAKSFSEQNNSKVLILGPDITSLPKQIEKTKNIKRQYFHQHFNQLPSFLSAILYPIRLLFDIIELFVIAFTYPSFNYCLVSYGESFFLSFCLSKWCHAKLIFDYPYLKWGKKDYYLGFFRRIEEKILSFADFHICSTQSIQLVLQVRNINAFVVHDPNRLSLVESNSPNLKEDEYDIKKKNEKQNNENCKSKDYVEKSDLAGINAKTYGKYSPLGNIFDPNKKDELFQIFGIDSQEKNTFLIGVPFPYFNEAIIANLLKIGDKLNQSQAKACFVIFASLKIERSVKKEVEKHHFASTTFKIIPLYSDAYTIILSCCDFGILFYPTVFGLEYSSELSDMLHIGIPIIAFKHGSVGEAIKDDENGFIFNNGIELAKILNSILVERNVNLNYLRNFYQSSKFEQKWDIEWKRCFKEIYMKKK